MRSQAGSVKFSLVLRASTACLLAFGASACSSEAMRFTDTPFASPFKTGQAQAPAPARDPATTGSIGRVASTPVYSTPAPAMAAVRSQPLPPPQSAVALRSAAPQPVAGNASGWSAQGGTPIVVAQGETLDMISSRYGVPRAALISANGLSGPTIAPGSRLTIPVYNAASAGAAPAPRQQVAQAQSETRSDASRFVTGPAPAASLAPVRPAAPVQDARAKAQHDARAAADAKAAAAQSKAAAAAEAKAKADADALAMRESRARFAAEAKAKAAARASTPVAAAPAPVAKVVVAAKPVVEKPVVAEAKPVRAPAPEKARPVVVASAPATEPKVTAIPKADPEPATTASLPKVEEAGDKADFRWPARGRVIAGFSGRGGNEGINIAVPEGTPIKAAEGGTVAYAGNELKGYGNLVLIRHPNGYVSAYAHNGELSVKRGETVKRGQVVAKSGQSGNVSSPQLHFELRKGSSPVDPTPYLNN
ncbi:LysM peptidoglycan-binding domain-containing M23 family metallopeptidase [Bosea sp. 124]|uniref:LysM peptidoglycan-binding domain-containing M23 family metallopeptidase n=1 Tax=Bosea sp. 124 TaxID=2135642 RepID=UPI000D4E3FD9|nr:LysM peptidoglycan-binding domain-containing M23 family metallopeptidase [Bosea sp. 124]PTM42682.1 murein DD-endopeptidase MepM/ murein hydrolase activator NlpD [Bosea sp. 124]